MRTARRLGWRTVAIYTDLDADAPHVRAADDAVRVASYLDVDAVVAAARESGAGFVHPGYGFLSERAPFARPLAEAGITLVGPSRRRDGRDGPQGRRPRDRGRRRRAGGAVLLPGRRPGHLRLPGAGQGRRRWWRQGHAHRAQRPTTRRGPRRRPARGAVVVRRRHDAGREVRRVAGATSRCRSSATPTAPCCTSSSATARPSAATRRCSRRRPRRRSPTSSARRSPRPRSALAQHVRLHQRRHRRVPARRRDRRVLLPGDEHPPPGRAPGHRGGRAVDGGRSTSSSCSCGSRRASRWASPRRTSRSTGHAIEARVYAEDSFARLPAAGRDAPASCGGRPATVSASTTRSSRSRRSPRPTTRCSAR